MTDDWWVMRSQIPTDNRTEHGNNTNFQTLLMDVDVLKPHFHSRHFSSNLNLWLFAVIRQVVVSWLEVRMIKPFTLLVHSFKLESKTRRIFKWFKVFVGFLLKIFPHVDAVFLRVMVPPIVFEAALNIDKKSFNRMIVPIMIYAVFGTLMSTVLTVFSVYYGTAALGNGAPQYRSLNPYLLVVHLYHRLTPSLFWVC